jgi:hypothetical protein
MKTCWLILVSVRNWECHITHCAVSQDNSAIMLMFFLRMISTSGFLAVPCWDLVMVTLDYHLLVTTNLQFLYGKVTDSEENAARDWKINSYRNRKHSFLLLNYLQCSVCSPNSFLSLLTPHHTQGIVKAFPPVWFWHCFNVVDDGLAV